MNTAPRLALLALSLGTLCSPTVLAHDFWLQPREFWMEPQVPMSLTLQVGHAAQRQRSSIRLRRIANSYAIAPDGAKIDLRPSIHPGGDGEDGTLRFDAPGAYVLVLTTDNQAQSHLPAARFNDYLKMEGLAPALEIRTRTGRTHVDGSESYRRLSKAIVQVGAATGSSQTQVTLPVNLPLEIVPEVSPYSIPRSKHLPVRVLYEGQPLPGALIKFTNLEQDDAPLETHRTDGEGRARFTMPDRGTWLLNVIWTRPLPASGETDFETYFSSLTFGFPTSGE